MDGFVVGDETCDSGTQIGCKSDCKGALPNYSCIGGDMTSPSICTQTALTQI